MTADGFDSGSILAGSPQMSTPRPYNFRISLLERRSFPRRLGRPLQSPSHLTFLLPLSLMIFEIFERWSESGYMNQEKEDSVTT